MYKIRCGCREEKLITVEIRDISPRIAEVTEDRSTLRLNPVLIGASRDILKMVASHESVHLCYPYLKRHFGSKLSKLAEVYTRYPLISTVLLSVTQKILRENGINQEIGTSIVSHLDEEVLAYIIGFNFISLQSAEALAYYDPDVKELIAEMKNYINLLYKISQTIINSSCFLETYFDVFNAITNEIMKESFSLKHNK